MVSTEMRISMSEILPNSEPAENEVAGETRSAEPSFFQKNKLAVSIVSAVVVVALGVGGFLLMRPSPAQPYLDKVCQAFNGLQIGKTSYDEAKELISEQESNMDLAIALDREASLEVNTAFEDFENYAQRFRSTTVRFAVAVALSELGDLGDISKQMDRDSAFGKSTIALMDTACGR